ncbi:hypothetical protein [Salipiger mangrovisoli]|uniref:Uncharacterized protein n=1 Tax=Salipiger mangrovisoli TaxID=2865933 RepID=A0ABR9X1K0_9RHOB|nr:hypothetical protein [Salipiger mangrovisoli]MBE9637383.1 hypothetical protein [Salipiger mangrovisoli]
MAAVSSIASFLRIAASPWKARDPPALAALREAVGFDGETGFPVPLALGAMAMLTAASVFRIWGFTDLRGFVRGQSVGLASRLVALHGFTAARLFPALQRIHASAAALRGDLPAVEGAFGRIGRRGVATERAAGTAGGEP